MSTIKIILAESSDIMLNGLQQTLLCNHDIEVIGKASSLDVLCRLIIECDYQMVVIGPMISQRYSNNLNTSLMVKFPGIKLVQIAIEESAEGLMKKIHEASRASIC